MMQTTHWQKWERNTWPAPGLSALGRGRLLPPEQRGPPVLHWVVLVSRVVAAVDLARFAAAKAPELSLMSCLPVVYPGEALCLGSGSQNH